MVDVFLKIVNMSISASWLVLAVLVFRFVFKKAPKWIHVLLWGIVAVRLLCPFSIESALSLIPSAETISPEIMMSPEPTIHTGVPAINSVINPIITETFAPEPVASANPLQIWIPVLAMIWGIGVALLLAYTAISYWRLRRRVRMAVLLRDNIFQSEAVSSPFVLGIIKPKIYLPFQIDGQNLEHVVSHEQAHIRRRDHWWKPLGFLLLTIHWFNPLMWLTYVLLCRDIELACDEKVVKELGKDQRADYSQALLACSVSRRMIAACPLAFGEVGVKERVKSVMNYKKPAFWVVVISVVVCMAVAVCFLTNPKERVQDLMKPGTAWISEEYQLFFAMDEDNVIEGTFTDQNEDTTISVGYRFAGKYNAVFDIYRGDWKTAQKSSEAPLLAGMLKAQNGTLVLEVEQDSVGLGVKQIVFSETDAEQSDMSAATAGKTYLYEKEGIMGSFTITLYDDGTFTYYEGMASSYLAFGTWKQEGDTITLTDDGHGGYGLVNHFKREGDDLIFIAEDSANFVYVKVQDGERFHCTGEAFKSKGGVDGPEEIIISRKLTLDDVLALSEKGADLTWSDFEDYSYVETGHGLCIRIYDIDEQFGLSIGGAPDRTPMYIYLCANGDDNARIDIRDGDVDAFIAEHRAEALLTEAIYDAILNHNKSDMPDGLYHCASFVLLEKEELCIDSDPPTPMQVTVYGMALHEKYGYSGATFHTVDSWYNPVKLTFEKTPNGAFRLSDAWFPKYPAESAEQHGNDIYEQFSMHSEDLANSVLFELLDYNYLTQLKQECYDQAVRYGGVDTNSVVESLFEVIESSPATSSRPADYISAHRMEYRELTYYGQYTLRYCFEQFLQGGQDGLRGHLMAVVCRDVATGLWPRAIIGDAPDGLTGQECFDQYKANVLQMREQFGATELAEMYPDAGLLLEIMGESESQQFKWSTVQIVEPGSAVVETEDDFGMMVPDEWLERDSGMTAPVPGEDVDPDFSIPTDNGITEDVTVVQIPDDKMENGQENTELEAVD